MNYMSSRYGFGYATNGTGARRPYLGDETGNRTAEFSGGVPAPSMNATQRWQNAGSNQVASQARSPVTTPNVDPSSNLTPTTIGDIIGGTGVTYSDGPAWHHTNNQLQTPDFSAGQSIFNAPAPANNQNNGFPVWSAARRYFVGTGRIDARATPQERGQAVSATPGLDAFHGGTFTPGLDSLRKMQNRYSPY